MPCTQGTCRALPWARSVNSWRTRTSWCGQHSISPLRGYPISTSICTPPQRRRAMKSDIPLYKFWADYPTRDVEYMRWYPPTLELIDPHTILDGIARGPEHMAFYLH